MKNDNSSLVETVAPVMLQGGCLCGAIRYQTRAMPFDADHCHCRQCQRSTGAIVASWMDFKVSEVTWFERYSHSNGSRMAEVSTEEMSTAALALPVALKEFESSTNVRRGFCGHCGTSLTYRDLRYADYMTLSIASLDEPNLVPVNYHIHTQSQVSWLKIDDNTVRYLGSRTANS